MVKIRLRRIGAKGRPYYRVVVAPSTAGRDGRFVENIGSYDPVAQPKKLEINEERALHWLNQGAQPTETTAYLLNKLGILPKYLETHPDKKKDFKYLDKRTASISKPSSVDVAETKPEPVKPKEVPVVEEPVVEVEAVPVAAEEVVSTVAPSEEASAPEIETPPTDEPVEEAVPKEEV